MATIVNANAPQLKAAQKWIDAYVALDAEKINTVFSKNYKHQTFPKSLGLPEETKEEYFQRFGVFWQCSSSSMYVSNTGQPPSNM